MNRHYGTIGIIAEDKSDINSVAEIIYRIAKNRKIGVKGMGNNGCGMLMRKCRDWAQNLHERKCSFLIVVHDSDNNNPNDIFKKIDNLLDDCPISKKLISIPVEEIEAWLLSDSNAIKIGLKLKNNPVIPKSTELIHSPKEYLGKVVYKASRQEKIYDNTKHNVLIAKNISIETVKKTCPSFSPFFNFIEANFKN